MGLKLRLDTESPGAGVTCNRQRKHHPVKSNPGDCFLFSPGKAAAGARARTSTDLLGFWLAALAPAVPKLAIAVGGWGGVRRIWERRGGRRDRGRERGGGDFGGFGGGLWFINSGQERAESREMDAPRGCASPRAKRIQVAWDGRFVCEARLRLGFWLAVAAAGLVGT